MEMARGEHLLCIPQPMEKTLNDASEDEVNAEKERFRDKCFLLHSDKTRYGELLEDLKKGPHKEIYGYPKTVTDAYKLLIITSRDIGI